MNEMKTIPARSEVPVEHTWAIEDMYATKADWEKDIESTKQLAQKAASYEGMLGESAGNLLAYCQLEEEMGCHLGEVYGYAARIKDQDTADSEGQAMEAKAMSLYVECSGLLAFSGPEILAIDDEKLNGFFESCPELQLL